MRLHSLFLFYLTVWRPLGYVLVAFGMVFEGDGMLFTSAFLTAEGFFDIGDILIVIFISVLLGDSMWYWIGKKYAMRFPRFVNVVNKFAKPFDRQMTRNPTRTLIVTKFLYGAHHAVLIRSGMLNLGFKKFIKGDLIAIPVWVSVVGGLGFFSERTLLPARQYLKFAEISLLLGLIAFFALEYFLHRLSVREMEFVDK
jgi:membrane-associated protein